MWSKHNRYYQMYGDYLGGSYKYFRVNKQTWWEQEMPTQEEYAEGIKNLDKVDWKVDYIITHDCSSTVRSLLGYTKTEDYDELTSYFNMIYKKCDYKKWYFGHLHQDNWVTEKDCLLYHNIVPLGIDNATDITSIL